MAEKINNWLVFVCSSKWVLAASFFPKSSLWFWLLERFESKIEKLHILEPNIRGADFGLDLNSGQMWPKNLITRWFLYVPASVFWRPDFFQNPCFGFGS